MNQRLPFHEQLRQERERRGWSQDDIAEKLGCDSKTVSRWESGVTLPRPYHRQRLCELFGKDAEEFGLLAPIEPDEPVETPIKRVAWGEAPEVTMFYGRSRERAELRSWLQDEHCHVIAILGMGGMGKTTLAAAVARQLSQSFSGIFWRSLHNALPFKQFLRECLQTLSPLSGDLPVEEDALLLLVIQQIQQDRCLIVLDNMETVLWSEQPAGHYQAGYEGYGRLIQSMAEIAHQSVLLLTSREKPAEIAHREGKSAPVRSLRLTGIEETAGRQILRDKELFGSDHRWTELIRLYSGNPLALKIVAEPIRAVFGGDIARFLGEQKGAFGDITMLLDQQFARLSAREQEVLTWLAIEREALSLEELRKDLLSSLSREMLVESLDSLQRRSLIETQGISLFSLQPVIMEYMTGQLVRRAFEDFGTERWGIWTDYALIKAQTKDYIRDAQQRLILAPLAEMLLSRYGKNRVKQIARDLLKVRREQYAQKDAHDYAAGNLLNLVIYLQWDVRDLDFSYLAIRQAYLQNALLPDVNFSHACFIDTRFTYTLGNILSLSFDPAGERLAVGTTTGENWVYHVQTGALLLNSCEHTDAVWCVSFNADGRLLASSSDDRTVRLWDAAAGQCLATLSDHTDRVRSVAFSPDGQMLASGGDDQAVRLWDVGTKQILHTFLGHTDRVWSVAFSPDGETLASGGTDQTLRLWDMSSRQCRVVLKGHEGWIRDIAFSPDGMRIASASDDQTIRLWDSQSGEILHVLHGHTNRVWSVAFSPDGSTLASGSEDQSIRLWDSQSGQCLKVLSGHTGGVRCVAFNPISGELASGGDDQTIRLWDTNSGRCLRVLQGYANRVWSGAFSPDGQTIVSSSEDRLIRLWDSNTGRCLRVFPDRIHAARIVAYSPGGHMVASGGEDQTIRLWDTTKGRCLAVLRGHTNWIRGLAFSGDGQLLASGSEDNTVRLWMLASGQCLHTLTDHTSWVRAVAFNPDSSMLATCGDDSVVRLWDVSTGRCLHVLQGHTGRVRSVVFSPIDPWLASASEDGTIRFWDVSGQPLKALSGHTGWVRALSFRPDGALLASGGDDMTVRLWDSLTGQCVRVISAHEGRVRWVAFAPDGYRLASGGDDGAIKLWDSQTGICLGTLLSERPYERMNITGAEGLSDAQRAMLRALGAVEN